MPVTCVQMCFHTLFFAQGLFISTWKDCIHADLQHLRNSIANPIMIFGSLVLYGIYLPGNHSQVGSVYTYPIYTNFHMNCLFVLGAWLSLYCILYFIKSETNCEFNPAVYKLTTDSSLWCYISHCLFDNMFLSWFIVPFKNEEEAKGGFAFLFCLFLTIIFTEITCIGSYIGLTKLHKRIFGSE